MRYVLSFLLAAATVQGSDLPGSDKLVGIRVGFFTNAVEAFAFDRFSDSIVRVTRFSNFWVDFELNFDVTEHATLSLATGYYRRGTELERRCAGCSRAVDLGHGRGMMPVTSTFRIFPVGRGHVLRPYVGWGGGAFLSFSPGETVLNVDTPYTGDLSERETIDVHADLGGYLVGGLRVRAGEGADLVVELRYLYMNGLSETEGFRPSIGLGGPVLSVGIQF